MAFEYFLINDNFKVNNTKQEPVPISTEQRILNLATYDVFSYQKQKVLRDFCYSYCSELNRFRFKK